MPEFYIILARKIIKNTRIFMIFARKLYKIPEFYMIFARKMPEFYIIVAGKILFPNFRGKGAPPPCPPVFYAYALDEKYYRFHEVILTC